VEASVVTIVVTKRPVLITLQIMRICPLVYRGIKCLRPSAAQHLRFNYYM
jgi:hypothetical protein